MADVDHPKTHVEDQELDASRRQPESPKHEGIDPLTESDTMYPREDIKGNAEKLAKKEAKEASVRADAGENSDDIKANDATHSDQKSLTGDVPADSQDAHAAADKAKAKEDTDEANVNADGKLPKDAKVANHKSSDKQNTSASNKPQTKAGKPAETTDSKTATDAR